MNPTKNDLSKSSRTKLVQLLNARLVDAVDLMLQAKEAHWNVKGPSFIALHELFDAVHAETEKHVDTIAERAVQLGGVADGGARTVARNSKLDAYPKGLTSGQDHADALSNALARFGKLIRQAIDDSDKLGDADTADLLTEVSRANDLQLWFVEAHLQGGK